MHSRPPRWLLSSTAITLGLTLALVWQPLYVFACAVTGATAYQASLTEVGLAMERAAISRLGPNYAALPPLERGYPEPALVSAPVPCVLIKAMGYVEASWRQASGSVQDGTAGPVMQSSTCGYGIMQITSGMRNPGELPKELQEEIASDYRFNIAWGAKMLADKWNAGDYFNAVVGSRDPSVAEHWYYAVWGYNQFTFKNNPNNPDYPWPRPAFDGTQSRTSYPYQELVWGYAAHPPTPVGEPAGEPLWEPVALGLPRREDIGQEPGPIPSPLVRHAGACRTLFADPAGVSVHLAHGASSTSQTLSLAIAASPGAVSWEAQVTGGSWLLVAPRAGKALPAQVILTVDPRGLPPGTHRASVIFSAQEGITAATLPVELHVESPTRWFIPYLPRRALGPAASTTFPIAP